MRQGQGQKVIKRPENIQCEVTEIEMMLTKGDSHQGEEGHGHRLSHYRGKGAIKSLKFKKM